MPGVGPHIRFVRPVIPGPDAWVHFLTAAYQERQFTNRGPVLERFEATLEAAWAPSGRVATLTTNATAGITAALHVLGVRGRVICPAFTFPATAQAILAAGCEPVLCDVDADTWELSPETVAAAAHGGAGAIVHVRALGQCRDLAAMEAAARAAGLPLVVDSAACLGGRLPSEDLVGRQGEVEIFSLHATKPMGIGEGGVVFSAPQRREALRCACNFGQTGGDVVMAGANAKMSEFQAAVGLAVLKTFEAAVAHRRRLFARYAAFAASAFGVQLGEGRGQMTGQSYPLLLPPGVHNQEVERFALHRGVQLRSYYAPALHESRAFARCAPKAPLRVAGALSRRMICLPLYADMTRQEQDLVLRALDAWRAQTARKPVRRRAAQAPAAPASQEIP